MRNLCNNLCSIKKVYIGNYNLWRWVGIGGCFCIRITMQYTMTDDARYLHEQYTKFFFSKKQYQMKSIMAAVLNEQTYCK